MKTIAVLAFVCFSFLEIQAQDQIKQGVYSLGGSIYYSSKTTIWDENEESFIVSPNLTYFITDQTELIFSCSYSVTTLPILPYLGPQPLCISSSSQKNIAFSLGLRYYFPAGSFAPFIGSSGQIMWEKNEYVYGSDQSFSPPAFGFTISGGIEIFIAQSAAVEPIITYTKTRFEDEPSVSGIYVGIGAKYFIY